MARNDVNGANPTQDQQVPLASYIGQGDVDQDLYPTHFPQLGAGGLRTVVAVADLNLIPAEMRQEGMMAYVEFDQTYYTLRADLVTWEIFSGAGLGLTTSVTRFFQNEIEVVLYGVTRAPVIEVYFEVAGGNEEPFVYADIDFSVYGSAVFGQRTTPAYESVTYLNPPQLRTTYVPEANRADVSFDAQRTGLLTAVW